MCVRHTFPPVIILAILVSLPLPLFPLLLLLLLVGAGWAPEPVLPLLLRLAPLLSRLLLLFLLALTASKKNRWYRLRRTNNKAQRPNQCCGSSLVSMRIQIRGLGQCGSVSRVWSMLWIGIRIDPFILVGWIQNADLDPDPGGKNVLQKRRNVKC